MTDHPNMPGAGHVSEPDDRTDWSGRKCPECGSQTLMHEANDDEWCSYIACTWGILSRQALRPLTEETRR